MSRTETALHYFRQNEAYLKARAKDGIERARKGNVTLRFESKALLSLLQKANGVK